MRLSMRVARLEAAAGNSVDADIERLCKQLLEELRGMNDEKLLHYATSDTMKGDPVLAARLTRMPDLDLLRFCQNNEGG
jgi:hypothetical protein